jgi:type VII secretion integral membrane protein EccD
MEVAVHQALGERQSGERCLPDRGLRRVSVHADSSRVDLVLSAAVPIGSLVPPIVDILAAKCGHRAQQVAIRHQLSLPGDIALDPSKTLSQLGIRDGTTLILTSSSTVLTPPHFDDVAEAVSSALAAAVRPWTRQAARLISVLAASWLTCTGSAVLIRAAFTTNDARRSSCAGVAAMAGFIALPVAAVAYRVFRDRTAGLTLGLAASGFAALAGLLAVPGELGAPNALLAMAAAATSATAMRVIGCCTTVFTALTCFAAVEAVAAVVGAVTAAPLQTIGAASAAISLVLVETSAPMSMMLAGLSSQVRSEPDPARGGPASAPHRLSARAIRANNWLTSLVVAFSAAAALGAVCAAAGSYFGGGQRLLGIAFATITGGVLLLRARSHQDLARSVPLVAAGTATLSATLVIAAVAYPLSTPYIVAASTMLAAGALCLGFITQTMTFSPLGRRSVELLEYLALAVVVPLACWICGIYGAARGMNLP